MKEIIERKIKDLEETKSDYLEMLEHGSLFEDSYLLKQLRLCNSKIDVLKDVIDEYEEVIKSERR